mmetsp:Transcript_29773/g.73170  ORF Transcript_29773/g.73170 Transcript_29773/m.73170 type:complete len:221 (-) Transcript_29773:84-746(-)
MSILATVGTSGGVEAWVSRSVRLTVIRPQHLVLLRQLPLTARVLLLAEPHFLGSRLAFELSQLECVPPRQAPRQIGSPRLLLVAAPANELRICMWRHGPAGLGHPPECTLQRLSRAPPPREREVERRVQGVLQLTFSDDSFARYGYRYGPCQHHMLVRRSFDWHTRNDRRCPAPPQPQRCRARQRELIRRLLKNCGTHDDGFGSSARDVCARDNLASRCA